MLTPSFALSQDAEFVRVVVRVPHVKTEDMEFYIVGNEFKFYCRPYYLRLTFDQYAHPRRADRVAATYAIRCVVEDGRETATYDWSSGEATVSAVTGLRHLRRPPV
jgi:protein SHQ1